MIVVSLLPKQGQTKIINWSVDGCLARVYIPENLNA